jgi:hypothetical protein
VTVERWEVVLTGSALGDTSEAPSLVFGKSGAAPAAVAVSGTEGLRPCE